MRHVLHPNINHKVCSTVALKSIETLICLGIQGLRENLRKGYHAGITHVGMTYVGMTYVGITHVVLVWV